MKKNAVHADRRHPDLSALTSAPLRHRIRMALDVPVAEVWALIGDLSRFPEYSAGLERVEATVDSIGRCIEFVCHFKPREAGAAGISDCNRIRWYEPGRGYASSAAQDNAFGLTNDLNLVTVEAWKDGTLLTWDEYYDAADLDAMRAEFDLAFADIGANLVRRFGGRVIERFVERDAAVKRFDVQGIELAVPRSRAFAVIADPGRLPEWTDAFASVTNGRAVMRTPGGEVPVNVSVRASAAQGTIDWLMEFPDGSVATAYSRVVEIDSGHCVYTFVLTPPPAPLVQLEGTLRAQAETLAKELLKLKGLLEPAA